MNKVLQLYWLRLSVRSMHPLHNSRLVLPYQSQLYNSIKYGYFKEERSSRIWKGGSDRYSNDFRGSQRGGFRQPLPEDVPSTIVKSLLSEYRVGKPDRAAIEQFRRTLNVNIQGTSQPDDVLLSFEELGLPAELKSVLARENFNTPSPIQSVTIPNALQGNDLINLAQTGSGKTLAFILPTILHIMNQPKTRFPRTLVLAPTRELAVQIESQFALFGDCIKSLCVYGGNPKSIQQRRLHGNLDVIIATPGRLLDFIEDGYPLTTITQVVLDEADRMLDMGFEPQIREILKNVRPDRQTLFFSATWPKEVQHLARDICQQNPQVIRIGSDGMTLNQDIQQTIKIVDRRDKRSMFESIIELYRETGKKVLVFCSRKQDTQFIEQIVNDMGIQATSLHGDLQQRERDYRMRQFKSGDAQVLIATNLASRGLDIQDIELVVNYDFPDCIEDYIHRIGRTGRAGRQGSAISLITSARSFKEKRVLNDLIRVLKQTKQVVTPELQELAGR